MIKKIIFPKNKGIKHYNTHYKFIVDSAKYAGISVAYEEPNILDEARFTIKIDDKLSVIDIYDFPKLYSNHNKYKYYFKYQYQEGHHENLTNIFPIGTMNFWDWKRFFEMKKTIKFDPVSNNIILNITRMANQARERRVAVLLKLSNNCGKDLDCEWTDIVRYWNKINTCLVSVHVPGARNNMLDKSQFQLFGFGCCTISPKLNTVLAFKRKIIPDTHYIICKDDYSDLLSKIEWCRNNRVKCKEIGNNAEQLFLETSTPTKIWEYMEEVTNAI